MQHVTSGRIVRHTGHFRYEGSDLPFHFWSHLQDGQTPDTIIFLGTGQTKLIAKWAAQASPTGTVVVEGAPHWHAHPSAHDIYDFMYGFTRAAFLQVCAAFRLTLAHVVAQSQAAPGVVRLGSEYGPRVGNVVLLAPLGFAATIFGATPRQRMRTLILRGARTFLQPSQSPLYDPRNLYVGLMLLRAFLLESERGASTRKYAAGLAYDMRADCRRLLHAHEPVGKTVTMLLGEQDKVFTVHEIQPLVAEAGLESLAIEVLPGVSHLSLAVRSARQVLQKAVAVARRGV